MSHYTTQDVARILDLSTDKVRRYARAALVEPDRGARNQYRFSFQDLVVLRTARDLEHADVPARRIHRALKTLQNRLQNGQTLTSLRIVADAEHVVVEDRGSRWAPESGQFQIDFGSDETRRDVVTLSRHAEPDIERSADEWYELACSIEAASPYEAQALYRRAIEVDPGHADARVNLGRLLHEEERYGEARDEYARALEAAPEHATAAFNLGVVLEDLGEVSDARDAYHHAIEFDPQLADAFYNLSRIYEEQGDRAAALRYLQRYERLTRSRDPRQG